MNWAKIALGVAIVLVPIAPPFDDLVGFALIANGAGVKIPGVSS